ncbi:hypothetical protein PGB34_18560 [Xenophilus arseniciresistens]|uniref:Uncharacterized protein n=1 Tax=Xenophilus arseniciresistens TaxID=1283306 RepID=A0AAE3N9X2_9BURK|nr:hypothetical protein [Xenophilus arseniciresistens]MDA7418375.1 hypothetical protein [Xenophilus arseniciresistens]
MTDIRWNLSSEGSLGPPRYRIGLVVRGMERPGVAPLLEGHADCVLSTGEPVGFYADEASTSGSAELSSRGATSTIVGSVYGYREMSVRRPHYVSGRSGGGFSISTLLAIEVSDDERGRFERAWLAMRVNPGLFGIVGLNCATHAGYAFSAAGLLTASSLFGGDRATREVRGPDTPTHLFLQLLSGPAHSRCAVYTGGISFTPGRSGGFDLAYTPLLSPGEVAELRAESARRHAGRPR